MAALMCFSKRTQVDTMAKDFSAGQVVSWDTGSREGASFLLPEVIVGGGGGGSEHPSQKLLLKCV